MRVLTSGSAGSNYTLGEIGFAPKVSGSLILDVQRLGLVGMELLLIAPTLFMTVKLVKAHFLCVRMEMVGS
jgi:hypothetical protein